MSWLNRRTRGIPMTNGHCRLWSRWGRYCRCGLHWPCPDRPGSPLEPPYPYPRNRGPWR
nr:hypothetical protein [Micromonospora sp. DSM 115978]